MTDSFDTIEQTVEIGGTAWQLTTLADRQQFYDPDGAFESAGVAPALWSLFGVIWPAGLLLAETMVTEPIDGLSILEAGCGLGLASMIVKQRGGEVLASDLHPLAEEFLQKNSVANRIAPVPFAVIDWARQHESLPRFDLIIGSDLLYEPEQPQLLADFIDRHIKPGGRVILTDPGRNQVGSFNQLMKDIGFEVNDVSFGKSRLVRYARRTFSHS